MPKAIANTDKWWKTSRVARALAYVTERELHYWADNGWVNSERFGKMHRHFDKEEVFRISIMAFLVKRGGMDPRHATKAATVVAKADVSKDGYLWGRYNSVLIGVPIEEIFSEAISR